MGWIKANKDQAEICHIELSRPTIPLEVPITKDNLPYIDPSELQDHNSIESLWLVIEDKVYDVTNYLAAHPGGQSVLKHFGGQSCTWQFWRFHTRKILDHEARMMLIGQTVPPPNRYKEPKKFKVGTW